MDFAEEDTEMGGVEPIVLPSSELNGNIESPEKHGKSLIEAGRINLEDSDSDLLPNPTHLSQLIKSQLNGRSDDESSLTSVDSPPSTHGNFVGVVIPKPVPTALPHASSRTGVVYDARMRFHTEKDTEEDEDIHPEDPRRIYEIFMALQDAGLLESETEREDERLIPFKLWRIPARFAEPSEICLVHSKEHYRFMESLSCQFQSSNDRTRADR
jgi:hypothetical protein